VRAATRPAARGERVAVRAACLAGALVLVATWTAAARAQGRVPITAQGLHVDLTVDDGEASPRTLAPPARARWSRVLPMRALVDVALGATAAHGAARARAARLLGRVGERRAALAALSGMVEREGPGAVRDAALDGILRRGRGETLPLWLSLHRRGEPRDRLLALRALGEHVRAATAAHEASGAGGPPPSPAWEPATRELVGALAIGGERDAAVAALVRAGPLTVPLLLRALPEPAAAVGAARALGRLGDDRALAPLVVASASDRVEVRLAAVEALGELGDPRAATALAARLEDPASPVVDAALRALARAGDAGVVERVAAHTRAGGPERRRSALATLLALDPARGAEALGALLDAGQSELGPELRALLLQRRHPALAPLLAARLRADPSPHAVAAALAVLDEGAGLPSLLSAARESVSGSAPGSLAAPLLRAVAISARTWRDALDEATRSAACAAVDNAARAALAGADPGGGTGADAPLLADEALLLPAIACDPALHPARVAAIRARAAAAFGGVAPSGRRAPPGGSAAPARDAASSRDRGGASARGDAADAAFRAAAARALGATCAPVEVGGASEDADEVRAALGPAVVAALRVETDPDVVRALAEAALACALDAPLDALAPWRARPDAAAEAMALSLAVLARAGARPDDGDGAVSPAVRRALLREAHAALRHGDERLRAATALALADPRLPFSDALLAEVIDDDASLYVRRAAARALAARLPAASAEVRERAEGSVRATDDAVVRDLLELGLRAGPPRARGAPRGGARARVAAVALPPRTGREVLWVRFSLADGPSPRGIEAIVRAPDGSVRRQRSLRAGALYALDLPSATADLEVLGETR
jgi:hypothetical protein